MAAQRGGDSCMTPSSQRLSDEQMRRTWALVDILTSLKRRANHHQPHIHDQRNTSFHGNSCQIYSTKIYVRRRVQVKTTEKIRLKNPTRKHPPFYVTACMHRWVLIDLGLRGVERSELLTR